MLISEAVTDLNTWLQDDARDNDNMLGFFREYIPRVQSYGIPVHRMFVACCEILHPNVAAWNWKYQVSEGDNTDGEFTERYLSEEELTKLKSSLDPDEPLIKMERERVNVVRYKSSDSHYPSGTIKELFEQMDYTDCYGLPVFHKDRLLLACTWATKESEGWSEEYIFFLNQTMPLLKMTLHLLVQKSITSALLGTSLGSDPGLQINGHAPSAKISEAVKDLNCWLQDDAREIDNVLAFFRECIPRLHSYGIPVHRMFVGSKVLHPQAAAWNWKYQASDHSQTAAWNWKYHTPESGSKDDEFKEVSLDENEFNKLLETFDPDEPLIKMERERLPALRYKKSDVRYPRGTVADLFDTMGFFDMYALPVFYKDHLLLACTWATKEPDGWSEEHILFFNQIMPLLKVTLHLLVQKTVTLTLFGTPGPIPGLQMHNGMLSTKISEGIKDLNCWLQDDARELENMLEFFREYIPRLEHYGIPVHRMFVGSKVLHPQAAAWNWKYEAANDKDGEDDYTERSISKEDFAKLVASLDPDEPIIKMERERLPMVRYKKSDSQYPSGTVADMFDGMQYTEMYGLPVFYKEHLLLACTWATKDPDGWSDEHILFFDQTMPLMKVTMHLLVQKTTTLTLLRTYLGPDPGLQVHEGAIKRGSGMTVRGVIWFSDIRGFTSLSSRLERDSIIDLINGVFDVTNSCIARHGGEILKFMGDGCMAIFKDRTGGTRQRRASWLRLPQGTEPTKYQEPSRPSLVMCSEAKKAAAEFQEALAEFTKKRNDLGLQGASVGVGLHYGDASYGNVGAASRLDFTVIGPHVNLASRVEGLCSKLGASVLATNEFVKLDNNDEDWNHRGEHSLKGVPKPVPIFELACTASSSSE